jgi:ribosomal protein L28
LRDDLSALLDCIIQHQKKKIILITDFLNREFEFKHLLNGKVEDKLIEIIDFEDEIILKIDICDYEIAQYTDKIERIAGFNPLKSNSFSSEILINEITANKKRIDVLLNEIKMIREDNVKKMKEISEDTLRSADELGRIDKVKNIFSKDLRSSWF